MDDVQFGCLISRTAKLHPEGGQWTLSRALGEVSGSLEAIEAKKTLAGKDFGELVRERRRQFGLPLPIAEKVLPFRARAGNASVEIGEARLAEAWGALQAAELAGRSRRVLRELEEAYLAEMSAYKHEPCCPPTAQQGVVPGRRVDSPSALEHR